MYLLDTNIFIDAKNRYYGMDICPAFWDWLIEKNIDGVVFSVQRVERELVTGGDELAQWARQRGAGFFVRPGQAAARSLRAVAEWVMNHQRYTQAAKNQFLQVADYYIVSQALADDYTVVTHEVREDGAISRVKIPNACADLGVGYVSPFEMLRRENARFVLER